ncbi:MAG: anthranilate phosphoribosyltransferase [Dehalococcoidales bacterium]|nr:anthranilate phosphoribosyltransferase [Dehalococcoidales bacterium]
MIKEAIKKLVERESLTVDESSAVMEEIMNGEATPAQLGSFVTALRMKGETADEIIGLAKTMRAKAIPVEFNEPSLDTCGTGGDCAGTFNISTTTAFIAAGAGIKVAKHGNRAMSSCCGSADVLEALGVKIDCNAEQVRKCIEEAGIGFMFAPLFHPAMKFAGGPRKEIGIRTVFNILGPLTNPAGAKYQVLGVPSDALVEKLAIVLNGLGCEHALVVHGEDGIDEFTITGQTHICEVNNGEVNCYYVKPEDFGLQKDTPGSLNGGSVQENAELLKRILDGDIIPQRNIVLMNAAAALVAGNKAKNLKDGFKMAVEIIDNGSAKKKLEQMIKVSNSC